MAAAEAQQGPQERISSAEIRHQISASDLKPVFFFIIEPEPPAYFSSND